MIYGSVCSGIEAATAAWHGLGWKPAFFSEIEAFPRAVLAHHYPDVPLHGDFTTIQKGQYAAIDLLVGGTPCQSFSVAGLRAGLDDPRGNLMLEFGALARRLGPAWLVWENVPGVLSSNKGRDFGTFLGMLGELGYGFAYRVLDAQYFGVAQRRRRVFVVGYLGDWRPAAAVLFERHSLQGHPAPSRQAGQDVAGAITAGAFSGGAGGRPEGAAAGHFVAGTIGARTGRSAGAQDAACGHMIATLCVATGQAGAEIGDDMAPTLNCNHEAPYIAQVAPNKTSNGDAHSGYKDEHGLVTVLPINDMATRHAGTDGSGNQSGKGHGMGIGGANDPMFTLTKGDKHAVMSAMQVRRLTPRECERLQGFQDDYTLIPFRNKPAADGPRYKALGNSMAVPCMHWIGSRIQAVSELMELEAAA
ncbi:DNA (cytosine-5)-methyltransferase 1 [Methylovorus glucosotrophus]|uniref:DNA cytosine methyltransferase n=1 Tax=Methylovorus glucosotrophus TaxID=266009 RepID=UPI0013315460|nr:DNA cytosine methyltransferase [Methylovorus glucosotrophus]KAF0844342.1 DNA (cytosine-5)-methyltransferase 1 [Methylovorus glucosotrophus]